MDAELEKLVRVWVTPKQLRKIADKLEQAFVKTKLGEGIPFYRIQGQGVDVLITVDQEEFYLEDDSLTPDNNSGTWTYGPWITLNELRGGALFETDSGTGAFKTEYQTFNNCTQCDCYLLGSGESAHFPNKNLEKVREIILSNQKE